MKIKVEGEVEVGSAEELGRAVGALYDHAKAALAPLDTRPDAVTIHWPNVYTPDKSQEREAEAQVERV